MMQTNIQTNTSLYHSSYLILYSLLEIFSVLICCGIVEYLRRYIVEKVKLLLLKVKRKKSEQKI